MKENTNEPLKDKIYCFEDWEYEKLITDPDIYCSTYQGFKIKDIKSAILYLKEQLLEKGYCKPGDDLLWEINNAFPDIIDGEK